MTTPTSAPARFLDEAKSLACIHCGICLGSCPTYLETGNENDSPRGRIYLMRAMQAGRLPVSDEAVRHIDLCLGCRACETACPSGVQYGSLLEETRDHIERNYQRSTLQTVLRRIAIEQVFPFPSRMELALAPARWAKALKLDRLLPKFVRDALDLVPDDADGAILPEMSPATTRQSRGRVGFISGCVMSVMFGKTNTASIRLLNRIGYDVVTPPAQGCCGALHAHSGKLNDARAAARHNIVAFEALQLDAIVINAAGCGSTLKEYGHLLHGDPAWAERGARFSAKIRDITEILARDEALLLEGIPAGQRPTAKVTYHDACHLAHAQRITKPPRDLVRAVAGKKFVELPEADLCCGSAGSYNLTEPEMAERLQARKVRNILQTGAGTVVTSNPGCLLQMQAGLRKAGAPNVRVRHIVDFLLEGR